MDLLTIQGCQKATGSWCEDPVGGTLSLQWRKDCYIAILPGEQFNPNYWDHGRKEMCSSSTSVSWEQEEPVTRTPLAKGWAWSCPRKESCLRLHDALSVATPIHPLHATLPSTVDLPVLQGSSRHYHKAVSQKRKDELPSTARAVCLSTITQKEWLRMTSTL